MGLDAEIQQLLARTLQERKQKNSAYSLRALAKHLHISPSYLHALLAGKSRPSYKMRDKLRESLSNSYVPEWQIKSAINDSLLTEVLEGKLCRVWVGEGKNTQFLICAFSGETTAN